jgi:hypothetical protein
MWETDLTEEEAQVLLDKAAAEILKRKMTVPAILMLEMHKPFARLGSQASIVFSPFLVPFLGFDNVNNYSRLMGRPGAVEELMQRLEKGSDKNKGTEDSCSITTPAT